MNAMDLRLARVGFAIDTRGLDKNEPHTHILVDVSTHLKNISQNGNLPQIGVKIKNIWNHNLVLYITYMYI